MRTIDNIAEYRAWRKGLALQPGERVGFFPTMGALHEGHLDLAREARKQCKVLVSSIFVNPAQFAAHEDLGTYPRTEEQDLKALEEHGVDLVFLPTTAMMYPPEFDTWVQTDVGNGRNEGAVRPHFFKGVATVCTKLFNIIQPDVVYFGQKDAQQCVVIEHIVRDLNMDISVHIVPTRRESDGLAMSSRNAYLSAEERGKAAIIFQALTAAKALIEDKKEASGAKVCEEMRSVLKQVPEFEVQYTSCLHRTTLLDVEQVRQEKEVLLAIAGVLGKTRLIDNVIARISQ